MVFHRAANTWPRQRQEDDRPEARNDDSVAPDVHLHGTGLDPVLEKREEVPLSFRAFEHCPITLLQSLSASGRGAPGHTSADTA
jgi:hypothetical protein